MKKFVLSLLLVVLLAASLSPIAVFAADPPNDATLFAANYCQGGLGLEGGMLALQWFTTQYGIAHPGLNWNLAHPFIINDYCGFPVYLNVGEPGQTVAWYVRVTAPYLRAAYNGLFPTK